MSNMRSPAVALLLLIPAALSLTNHQGSKQASSLLELASSQQTVTISKATSPSETMGGDGMDGPMQPSVPVSPVASSRHLSKAQVARGADANVEEGVSATALIAVPVFVLVLCIAAYCFISTERGREMAQAVGLIQQKDAWKKMEVGQDSDEGKWIRMALESPLVQEALSVMGLGMSPKPEGAMEMNTFWEGPETEEDSKPSDSEACEQTAQEPKASDDFDPNAKAPAEEADLIDVTSKAEDTTEEPVETVPAEVPVVESAPVEKISAAFTMDDDEFLKSIGADFDTLTPVPASPPQPEAAPVFEKVTTSFTFDDDDF